MSNQEKLEKYLLGDKDKKGYLKNDLSNGKVIMLSGKWGSGKTYFWQNKIVPNLNKKENKIPNHYISLYGKTSIDEIKNEIFIKIFESVDSFDSKEKALEITKKSAKLVSMFSSTINVLGVSLDLSKATDKTFNGLENLLENKKLKKTEEYLNSGAIICFDDFERKSKDIDLNDLFGFITQLTLNFDCKVVIILNDDVFESEEKRIFTNVKEKSVSKFLYFNPDIETQFSVLVDVYPQTDYIMKYWDLIIQTFNEIKVSNMRIYIQVIDNLYEWISSKNKHDDSIVRCLILLNINFILYHSILKEKYSLKKFENIIESYHGSRSSFFHYVGRKNLSGITFNNFYNITKDRILKKEIDSDIKKEKNILFLDNNLEKIKSLFFCNKYDVAKNVNREMIEKINDFIETGILTDE